MKFTIKVKLGMIFLVFLVSMLALGLLGIYSLMNVNNKSDQIVQARMPGVSISSRLNILITGYSRSVFEYLATDDAQERQKYQRTLDEFQKNIVKNMDDYKQLVQKADYASDADRSTDQAQINALEEAWNAYYPETKRTLALSSQEKKAEATDNARKVAAPLLAKVQRETDRMVAFNEAGSVQTGKEVTATYESARTSLMSIIVLALILGSVIILQIGRSVNSAIQDLLAVLREVAAGNMRVSAKVKTNDELGELSAATNQMVDQVKKLILKIQETAGLVASSSEEVMAGANQSANVSQMIAQSIVSVTEMTENQAKAVNLASGEMENVAASIEESAATVSLAADKTKDVVLAAENGSSTIGSAVKQMNSIEETVGALAEVVEKLGDRSKEIGQIVDTIAAIAGQTNLLALNAAIEAARAGEMGKGFAVVAEEVRTLAEQSRSATKEIANLISEIQADTAHAVTAMDKGTQEVKAGTGVISEAGAAFANICEMVETVSHQANEISRTMDGLANGTQMIVNSIQEIDQSSKNVAAESQAVSAATEEQSASMQQIAASSGGLSDLAKKLTEMSKQFKV